MKTQMNPVDYAKITTNCGFGRYDFYYRDTLFTVVGVIAHLKSIIAVDLSGRSHTFVAY